MLSLALWVLLITASFAERQAKGNHCSPTLHDCVLPNHRQSAILGSVFNQMEGGDPMSSVLVSCCGIFADCLCAEQPLR